MTLHLVEVSAEGFHTRVERVLFGGQKRRIYHFLDPVPADDRGEREGEVFDPILTLEDAGNRHNRFFVAGDGGRDTGHGCGYTVIGRPFTSDDFVGIFPGLVEGPFDVFI